jgi:hypothetical protein
MALAGEARSDTRIIVPVVTSAHGPFRLQVCVLMPPIVNPGAGSKVKLPL